MKGGRETEREVGGSTKKDIANGTILPSSSSRVQDT